jgi:hypothetical protein
MHGLKRLPIAVAVTLIAFAFASSTAGAQGFAWHTIITRIAAAATADHPAAIVAGSCTTADAKSAFKLDDVKPGTDKTGAAAALAASWSETAIDGKLADLVKTPYALAIAAGTKDPVTIACGAIAGTPVGDALAVAIRPVGQIRDASVAWLRQEGDKTHVTVFFASGIVPQIQ